MTFTLLPILILATVGLFLARLQRRHFHSKMRKDQVVPLQGSLHKILFTVESHDAITVWNTAHRRLYKISKDGNRWHIQTPSGKNLATVKNSYQEKYIVLAASSPVSDSPLLSTPSVIRMESNMFSVHNVFQESTFSFGSESTLRWCGMEHFEIVAPCSGHPEGIETVRERVAFCEGVQGNSLVILFDFDKINMEVLVSTFLLVLLCQGSSLLKARSNINTVKENNLV